jgi:hypothetical protein
MMLCTLAGLACNDEKVIWIGYRGKYRNGMLRSINRSVLIFTVPVLYWDLLATFRPIVKGYVLYDINNGTDNCATSLCGPMRAIAVDVSLAAKMQDFNLPMLADVRDMNESAVFQSIIRFSLILRWLNLRPA